MAIGKSPGPDGFSAIYLKKCKDLLAPNLFLYWNSLERKKGMRKELMLAHISVILKEDKDTAQCSSYRPISLMNED